MEERLRDEIAKWSQRLAEKRRDVNAKNEKAEEQLRLADDYIEDSGHFLEKDQLIESFEALVYAWAIIETLERLGMLNEK